MSTKHSKFLTLILRHDPSVVGITLDSAGWVGVDTLLAACAAHGRAITRAELEEIVATSDKQRFALDGDRIRANQGHSVPVELGLEPVAPPAQLFHGTVAEARRRAGVDQDHVDGHVALVSRFGLRRHCVSVELTP